MQVNESSVKKWSYADPGADPSETETDQEIFNRASVKIGDHSETYTETIENPSGKPQKTETQVNGQDVDIFYGAPGHFVGPKVEPGDTITYEISWTNYDPATANVIITDPLDDGADFVSAAYVHSEDAGAETADVTLEADTDAQGAVQDGNITDGDISIAYDAENRQVTWTLNNRETLKQGIVRLTIRVNDQAKKWWNDYEYPTEPAEGQLDDYLVLNRAGVKVGNHDAQQTNIMENPLPDQKKEEFSPGDGQLVGIGDEINRNHRGSAGRRRGFRGSVDRR